MKVKPEMRNRGVILIGGSGFVGRAIALELLKRKYNVVVLADIAAPPKEMLNNCVIYRHCDITNEFSIEKLFSEFSASAQSVIMLASVGMSGAAMLDPHTEEVNVKSTQVLINACHRYGTKSLIYASTYNVCFGGQEIIGGNSLTPYFPYEQHTDYYSRSKRIAEELVLQANNSVTGCRDEVVKRKKKSRGRSRSPGRRKSETSSDDKLSSGLTERMLTCVIRPAAIYGEGEERHFPRIVRHMDAGLFKFRIGAAMVDWVHADNLAQAFCNATDILINARNQSGTIACHCAGRAYSISDGECVDSFEFLRPLCEARGIAYPSLVLPVWLATSLAFILEHLFYLLRFIIGARMTPAPFLTRAEVFKVGVTHWFSMDEARKDLQYVPTISTEQGAKRMAAFYQLEKGNKNQTVEMVPLGCILLCALALGVRAGWLHR